MRQAIKNHRPSFTFLKSQLIAAHRIYASKDGWLKTTACLLPNAKYADAIEENVEKCYDDIYNLIVKGKDCSANL